MKLIKHNSLGSDSPRVSVISGFLNGEAFLAEMIESVIAQTYSNWEFLLVDDGSGPAATEIAKSYAARYPDKLFYLEHPGHKNRGVTASRNLGIQHARGEFLAIIDGDDVWLPSKLAEHVAILDAYPDVGMVAGASIYWKSWSNGQDKVLPSGHKQDIVIQNPNALLALYPFGKGITPLPSDIVLRTKLMRQLDGFEEEFVGEKQLYEDIAFLSKVFLASPVYFSSTTSLKYRLHPDSCVATVNKAGKYHEVRLYFLEWFAGYLSKVGNTNSRVEAALNRELRFYRNPKIHYFLSVPTKVLNRCRRLANRASRLLHNAA